MPNESSHPEPQPDMWTHTEGVRIPHSTHSSDFALEYEHWNCALINYATKNISQGSPVYLSVDEEVLWIIHQQFLRREGSTTQQAIDEFMAALRRCVLVPQGHHLDLARLRGSDAAGRPRGVGFLAAMVLAAHRMETEEHDDEQIDESDYFRRLREILGLPMEQGRPVGLKIDYNRAGSTPLAPEEPLWQA